MDKRIILYVVLGVLILFLILLVFFPGVTYVIRDSGATGNSVADKCKPESGYTEQEWREHMSHHPNIYQECLS